MTPQHYVAQKVFARLPDVRIAVLFGDPASRDAVLTIHALHAELLDSVNQASDESVAHARLGWWRQELAACADNQPSHPVSRALAPLIRSHDIQLEYLLEMVEGAALDLAPTGFENLEGLLLRCHRLDSMARIICAGICGYEDHDTLRFARSHGAATGLLQVIVNAGEDYRRQRLRLPQSLLQRFEVPPAELGGKHSSPALRSLIKELHQSARAHAEEAEALLPAGDRYRQRAALIELRLAMAHLEIIRRRDFEVLVQRPRLSPPKRLWLAWRAARVEEKRRRVKSGSANTLTQHSGKH